MSMRSALRWRASSAFPAVWTVWAPSPVAHPCLRWRMRDVARTGVLQSKRTGIFRALGWMSLAAWSGPLTLATSDAASHWA
eukprot:7876565-Pyramimonas_sp.AAC.1